MREDGIVSYYLIQHRQEDSKGRITWVESDLGHLLFHKLSYNDRKGETGDFYRDLLKPQSATSVLWQRYGINGYEYLNEAEATKSNLYRENADMQFRIVRMLQVQDTYVVAY